MPTFNWTNKSTHGRYQVSLVVTSETVMKFHGQPLPGLVDVEIVRAHDDFIWKVTTYPNVAFVTWTEDEVFGWAWPQYSWEAGLEVFNRRLSEVSNLQFTLEQFKQVITIYWPKVAGRWNNYEELAARQNQRHQDETSLAN